MTGQLLPEVTTLSRKEFFLISKTSPGTTWGQVLLSLNVWAKELISFLTSVFPGKYNSFISYGILDGFYFSITLFTLTLLTNGTILCPSNENFRWESVKWQIQYNCLTLWAKTLLYSQILFCFPEPKWRPFKLLFPSIVYYKTMLLGKLRFTGKLANIFLADSGCGIPLDHGGCSHLLC